MSLLAATLHPKGQLPIRSTAWDNKRQATFADALAAVRRHFWGDFNYSTSAHYPDMIEIPRAELHRLAYAVCYAH